MHCEYIINKINIIQSIPYKDFTKILFEYENNIYEWNRSNFKLLTCEIPLIENIYLVNTDNYSDILYIKNYLCIDDTIYVVNINEKFFKKYKFDDIILKNNNKDGIVTYINKNKGSDMMIKNLYSINKNMEYIEIYQHKLDSSMNYDYLKSKGFPDEAIDKFNGIINYYKCFYKNIK